ncbi:hypothetical protein NQ117_15095 [Paenibacillus sp. SC116]|uniref:YiiX/YebB-like N1pC/P60 family cysteine hydrolase n=1 Tax=Paenibacillus sp. SC116 TaxID=2968986 RepID=UPI00215A52B3|nr:YiiX/YebB-like N1pC/P60 family cysteine hydrolase [Paenibacillus sp. SC116]MCR8845007.1 hypothetical protein [Paenibacillus sp. SC116]
MKLNKFMLLALCAIMLFVIPVQAGASSNDQQLDQIVSLHGNGLTKEELKQTIDELSTRSGLSKQQITSQIQNELLDQPEDIIAYGTPVEGGTIQLDSSAKGNLFYQPASFAGVEHGHVGLYYTPSTIVESSSPKYGVILAAVADRKVKSGARIMKVNSTSVAQNHSATEWAKTKVGYDYDIKFFDNRFCNTNSYNCSQLVWCAFKQVANIDLDKNGGWGVYPKDIRDSSLITTLKSYN